MMALAESQEGKTLVTAREEDVRWRAVLSRCSQNLFIWFLFLFFFTFSFSFIFNDSFFYFLFLFSICFNLFVKLKLKLSIPLFSGKLCRWTVELAWSGYWTFSCSTTKTKPMRLIFCHEIDRKAPSANWPCYSTRELVQAIELLSWATVSLSLFWLFSFLSLFFNLRNLLFFHLWNSARSAQVLKWKKK